MKFFAKILIVVCAMVLCAVLFLIIATLTEYKPEKTNRLTVLESASAINSDTVNILTWNIGYCGLSDDMDFFYEGGSKMRTSKEKTLENLQNIRQFIKSNSADIVMLQEIDADSHRSYNTDQITELALPDYTCVYASDYQSVFVPLPLHNPTGKVNSGLALLSKFNPRETCLYAYQQTKPWPVRLFIAKPCFMLQRYKVNNNKHLVIINTHNSAYDNGNLRNNEMAYLKEIMINEYNNGNYVIAGGDWNQNPTGVQCAGNKYFKPVKMPVDYLNDGWQVVSDFKSTNRFLDRPYVKGKSEETVLDFFIISPNVSAVYVQCVDLEFKHSDHNPVKASFKLIK